MQPLLRLLGWPASVRLAATGVSTSVVMKPDPGGVFRLGTRRTVVLSIALRRLCGVSTGDDVLLVADPEHGVLVVHPLTALDQMISAITPPCPEVPMTRSQMELDAARLLLSKMGIAPADLLTEPVERPQVPTFADYIPVVARAVSAAKARSYSSYWRRLEAAWGSRRLDEPSPSEIKQLAEESRAQEVVRRNSRGGETPRRTSSSRSAASTGTRSPIGS
ncbi:hypothetical protein ACIA5G_33435 [Amycolatopsis sp. NPDC051758]|uniref:hypothetical protein n=1 Tax=Amycolatopsis sp. NPDC051758 TaxID=3363935 RepID=UPI0037A64FC5